jgi:hypothetical protein
MLVDDNKPSPFFNIFGHVLNLEPFTEAEALELIASSPQAFENKDIEWILAQSGRWPALLQIFCQSRLTALKEGRHDDAWQAEALQRMKPYRYLLNQLS